MNEQINDGNDVINRRDELGLVARGGCACLNQPLLLQRKNVPRLVSVLACVYVQFLALFYENHVSKMNGDHGNCCDVRVEPQQR